jgi:hypothetical protein
MASTKKSTQAARSRRDGPGAAELAAEPKSVGLKLAL